MFAPLKRIAILATALLIPGVAFSYVSIEKIEVDNEVPYGSAGFVVSITADVEPGDSWQSSEFNFDNYNSICLDHDDFGPGLHRQIFYVPFEGGDVAGDEGDDDFDLYTYDDDNCDDDNQYNVWNRDIYINDDFEWSDVTGFAVQKAFRPASDMEIQVDINCSAGSPGDDSAMIGDGEIQIFPQEFINPGNPNHNCVITEADVPAGYEVLYVTNPDEGDGLFSTEGCFFYGSGNMRSTNTCQIINSGLPATFTVSKNWEVFQDGDANFVELDELRVRLEVSCSRKILGGHVADEGFCMDDDADSAYNGCDFGELSGGEAAYWVVTGDGEMTVTVDNSGSDPVQCFADEDVFYSNTERSFTNCWGEFVQTPFEIGPGGSAGCGFVNTVFFEGIPTLSQYGMAIMALLMLGVGFVGFRRFV